ncbi:hypothetical protein CSIRO_2115 [Bradyrhizobiaceae bacterium SG-6C]|nr:hypothetical protein CSIRO_2115 [Bradyrhizobiaceae bacterium SG-6C]
MVLPSVRPSVRSFRLPVQSDPAAFPQCSALISATKTDTDSRAVRLEHLYIHEKEYNDVSRIMIDQAWHRQAILSSRDAKDSRRRKHR